MKATHTPAPWSVFLDGAPLHEDGAICGTGNGNEVRPSDDQKLGDELADLTLISAAPDLLDALKDIVADFGVCGMTEKAIAAIAKATGETP